MLAVERGEVQTRTLTLTGSEPVSTTGRCRLTQRCFVIKATGFDLGLWSVEETVASAPSTTDPTHGSFSPSCPSSYGHATARLRRC